MKLRAAALVVFLAALPRAASADAPDHAACGRAYESAQRLRRAQSLREAREALLVCARPECPAWVRRDCTSWLGEVETSLPRVTVTVRGGDARVIVDGEVVSEHVTSEPIPIDPGAHTIAAESPNAPRVEQRIVLREGERERRVELVLTPHAPAPPPAVASPPPTEPERPTPPLVYMLGGIGLVAAGAGAYFQISGMSQRSDLDACAPSCEQRQVDDARRVLWTGNVLLGVAVVTIAAATWLYVTRPPTRAAVR